MKTIYTITVGKYINECTVTAITSISIVAKYKDFKEYEELHKISDENKTWFKTKEDAEMFIEKQNNLSQRIEELKKEYS